MTPEAQRSLSNDRSKRLNLKQQRGQTSGGLNNTLKMPSLQTSPSYAGMDYQGSSVVISRLKEQQLAQDQRVD